MQHLSMLMLQSHWLTSEKGVHKFRYFLLLRRTPNPIVVCSCIYSYMHEETTIGFGVCINGRKYLN